MEEDFNGNRSPAAREARIRELAVLDWSNIPSSAIREKFQDCSYQTLSHYRDSDVYKEVWEELRVAWNEEMLRLPGTAELRKKVSHGMALSLNVLIEILGGGKAQNKDKISAARLMAQLDGRFLKGEDEDGRSREVDSVAAELLKHIEKQQRAN